MSSRRSLRSLADTSAEQGTYSVSGYRPGAFSDGAPGAPTPKPVSRVRQFEGPRGVSTRAAVVLKYVAFLLEVAILSGLVQALTTDVPHAGGAGRWMLFSAAFILVSAALGTMKNHNERNNIIKEARHYALGIVVRPGAALAFVMWGAHDYLQQGATNDSFAGLLGNALPILYFCWVVLPALVFVKMVFGLGQLNRSNEENQTIVERMTRQDGLQR